MEGLNKIKISLELDEGVLKGTNLKSSEVENHMTRHLAEYLKSKSADIFSTEELDTIANNICKYLLEKSDEGLYNSVLKLIKSSTGEFRGEFGKLLICAYIGNTGENKIKELVKKFNNGVEIYKPVLLNKIVNNQDINTRVYAYTHKIMLDAQLMMENLSYILIDRFDLLDKEKDKIMSIINKEEGGK